MNSTTPMVNLQLWRSDAVVLFDWLRTVDLDAVPIDHPAQRQALMDLLTRLETDTNVPYGIRGSGLEEAEIAEAQSEVARDMES